MVRLVEDTRSSRNPPASDGWAIGEGFGKALPPFKAKSGIYRADARSSAARIVIKILEKSRVLRRFDSANDMGTLEKSNMKTTRGLTRHFACPLKQLATRKTEANKYKHG